ncbi:MAG TPA: Tol-Pal system beta propeller repeat protein TolB [Roseiarcus sp.]|nr:Tol-Pal system beta propeller repeat protein TolB [Roseiarcus sp.]
MSISSGVFRAWLHGALAAAVIVLGPQRADAAGDVYIHAGPNFKPVTIAVTPFAGDEGMDRIGSVVGNDFARSIFLLPINPSSFPETVANPDVPPHVDAWKTVNAQFVLTGRVLHAGADRVTAQFRLWDVASGEQVAGEQYTSEATNARRVAHMIADAVFTRITGEKGFFDSRVVFVDESGPKDKRKKRLAVMDMDGGEVKYIGGGSDLVVTPRFSPSAQEVAYMSFGGPEPKVTLFNLETGQREAVGHFPGMTFAPRFSPDGQQIVMSLSDGASTNLYSMDLRSRETTRLTESPAIDTSPTYSPDGSQIAFESDRGGSQQIYVMSANGGPAKRISFGEGKYSTPVWSPRGDLIAFTRIKNGSFGVGVMKPDGSGERILVEGFHNEGPTFAPNGLYLMFFRDSGGGGGPRIYMTDIYGHGEFLVPTPNYASDPSWGPLMH